MELRPVFAQIAMNNYLASVDFRECYLFLADFPPMHILLCEWEPIGLSAYRSCIYAFRITGEVSDSADFYPCFI